MAASQNAGEYAFVKIRYKLPDGDVQADHHAGTEATRCRPSTQASVDQRFSVAVAAFGQKLRDATRSRLWLRQDHRDRRCRAGRRPVWL